MSRFSNFFSKVGEQVQVFWNFTWPLNAIRSRARTLSGLRFWSTGSPRYEGTEVNYDVTRQLYRNDGANALGAGFCKPIVDLQVGFIGIPTASTEDALQDDFLNECIEVFWADEIQQAIRDSIRDSKCIVRIHKPDLLDPLMTLEESQHCYLEVLTPERVDIERDPRNKRIIERAVITYRMVMVEDDGNPAQGRDPTVREHEVIEIIDRQRFRFFDKSDNREMPELSSDNRWGFVPLVEWHNEWSAELQGGQSDLESVLPFINAMHDVLAQGLEAHKYHSTPKLKLKLDSAVEEFIANNFPNAVDENGNIIAGTELAWTGREALFLQIDEEAQFLEARSVLGDTKALAEFLVDCICIASQTPEWAFMRVDSGSANSDRNAQTVPFTRKIMRKRRNNERPIQELLKMVLVINSEIPVRARLSWETVRPDDQFVSMQALQQLIMGLEVAKQSGEISDETYRQMLRVFVPVMKNPKQEALDAAKNTPAATAPTNGSGNPANVPVIAGGPQGRNE